MKSWNIQKTLNKSSKFCYHDHVSNKKVEVTSMIHTSYFYTQLNLTDETPIMLDIYNYEEEAREHFQAIKDKGILQESFVGLTNIPLEEFASVSLVRVSQKYGRQIGQQCIARKSL